MKRTGKRRTSAEIMDRSRLQYAVSLAERLLVYLAALLTGGAVLDRKSVV